MNQNLKAQLSHYLSSYSGADLENALEENFTAEELMSFNSQDLMSFDGTFKDQRDARRSLVLKVTGHATNDDVLYINPDFSIGDADNGNPLSGKGVSGNALTISTSPGSVKALYYFLQRVPMSCMGIRVVSTDPIQLIQDFTQTSFENGPFNNGVSETITTTDFQNERDFRDNMVTINTPFKFDWNTRIAYPILAGKTVSLTLNFGVRLDIVKAAQESVKRALANKMQRPVYNMPALPGVRGAGRQTGRLALPVGGFNKNRR